MEPDFSPPPRTDPRRIPIDNPDFGSANLEAWANVIRSYRELHPQHRVILHYEGNEVQSLTYLFKLGKGINREGFDLVVSGDDRDFRHVAKLVRLLVEASGPDYGKFIVRELHRTLKLF